MQTNKLGAPDEGDTTSPAARVVHADWGAQPPSSQDEQLLPVDEFMSEYGHLQNISDADQYVVTGNGEGVNDPTLSSETAFGSVILAEHNADEIGRVEIDSRQEPDAIVYGTSTEVDQKRGNPRRGGRRKKNGHVEFYINDRRLVTFIPFDRGQLQLLGQRIVTKRDHRGTEQ